MGGGFALEQANLTEDFDKVVVVKVVVETVDGGIVLRVIVDELNLVVVETVVVVVVAAVACDALAFISISAQFVNISPVLKANLFDSMINYIIFADIKRRKNLYTISIEEHNGCMTKI